LGIDENVPNEIINMLETSKAMNLPFEVNLNQTFVEFFIFDKSGRLKIDILSLFLIGQSVFFVYLAFILRDIRFMWGFIAYLLIIVCIIVILRRYTKTGKKISLVLDFAQKLIYSGNLEISFSKVHKLVMTSINNQRAGSKVRNYYKLDLVDLDNQPLTTIFQKLWVHDYPVSKLGDFLSKILSIATNSPIAFKKWGYCGFTKEKLRIF
jgi:hypothetical protein